MVKVLYIDDDEGIRRLAIRALTRRGYEVVGADSAESGLALLRAEAFDLVAVDHYMPGRNGLEALAEIKALPSPPPVVYVTGSEESNIAVSALKAGAADYVVKSVGDEFFDLLAASFALALERQTLLRQRAEAERALQESNERLGALLQEANHRIANSLQIVASFIQIQANAVSSEEARVALKEAKQRVQTISQVHRRLYTSTDIESIDMVEYLAAILRDLESAWSTVTATRPIRFASVPLRLRTDHAVSVGVIVNELVLNACKYAYKDGAPGEIRVAIDTDVGTFKIRIEDDGIGFPADVTPKGTGIGTKVVEAMARSLKATVAYGDGVGARITLTAPIV